MHLRSDSGDLVGIIYSDHPGERELFEIRNARSHLGFKRLQVCGLNHVLLARIRRLSLWNFAVL